MTAPTPLPTFYSVKEVAQLLKVSDKSVRRWIECGDLPLHRIRRSIRISETDLVVFVRARREA